MKINHIQLQNFRCFPTLDLDLDDQLTVIVGENGTGKSSVLEAISIALAGYTSSIGLENYSIKPTDALRKYINYGETIDVRVQYPILIQASGKDQNGTYTWQRSRVSEKSTRMSQKGDLFDQISQYKNQLDEGNPDLILPLLVYYGTGRLWTHYIERKNEKVVENSRINGYKECFDGATNNKLMNTWFRKMTTHSLQLFQRGMKEEEVYPEFHAVKQIMIHCFEGITGYDHVYIDYNLDIDQIEFEYDDGKNGICRMPISQLSDGYKSTLSLVADIAYRMALLNPQLAGNVIEKTSGVVLIDEIDLHLHPAWQQRIMEVLIDLFPSIQFIVTTHAPALIHSAKKESLRILDQYEIKYVDEQTYGKDANTILNQIMLVSSRPQRIADMFNECNQLINQGHYDEAIKILDELETLIDSADPELVSNRTKIRLRKLRDRKV